VLRWGGREGGREGEREGGRYLQTRLPLARLSEGVHVDIEANEVGGEEGLQFLKEGECLALALGCMLGYKEGGREGGR